jgi:nitrilase
MRWKAPALSSPARIGDKLAPDQEGIVYAHIDLVMITVAKAAADPAGH